MVSEVAAATSLAPASQDPNQPSQRRGRQRETAQAIVVLLVLIVVFLWKPLTTPNSYYAPTDVLQDKTIFQVPPPTYQIQNPDEYDPPTLFYPWLKWDKSSLSRLDLPTWNPYNGAGVPQLANFESAVFSPFSIPFYIFPFDIALVGSVFLKLFVSGLFTYLFLRRVRFGHLGSLTASVIFTFSAYNLVWLSWTAAAAAACLPVGLYCAELVIQARDPKRLRIGLAALSLAVAVSFFAGYAETTFFALVMLFAWLALRLFLQRASWTKVLSAVGASMLGVTLALVQILPFLQYLGQSTSYGLRAANAPPTSDSRLIDLLAFPNLFGNPSQQYHDVALPEVAFRNFKEAAAIYVGLITLLLALVGLISLRKTRSFVVGFFVVAAAAWALYSYNVLGIEHLLRVVPGLRAAYPGRSDPVWALSAGCLAAAGIDQLLARSHARQGPGRRLVPIAGLVVLAGAVIGWAFYAKGRALSDFSSLPGSTLGSVVAQRAITDHVLYMSLTFAAGVVAVVLLILAGRRRAIYIGAGGLLVVTVFAQTGYLFRHLNPTVDKRYFYPVTPTLAALSARTGDAQTLRLDQSDITADSNLWYQVRNPISYDAIGIKHYDQLYKGLLRGDELPFLGLGFLGPEQGPRNLTGLQALGIRFVSTGQNYPFGTEAADPRLSDPSGTTPVSLSEPSQQLSQQFTASASGLDLVLVPLASAPPGGCQLRLTLEELPSGRRVASSTAPCNSPEATFAFAPITDSAGKQYRVLLNGTGGASVLKTPNATPAPGQASAAIGNLVMAAYSTDVPGLEPIENIGSIHLFEVPASPAPYFSPGEARTATSDAEAMGLLEGGSIDVNRTVLLDHANTSSVGSSGSVRVVKRSATEVHLRVTRSQPGWLVALQTYYPGWTATVNGHGVPITRADVAFQAIPVGRGTSDVVLRYQPAVVTIGLIVSVLSLVILLALVSSTLWRRRVDYERQT